MKITYTGTAPGQAERIEIGGFAFVRGKTYCDIPTNLARILIAKGGFEQAKAQKASGPKG